MSFPDPMAPEHIHALSRSLRQISDLDTAIGKLGDLLANSPILPDELGSKLRATVGPLVLPHFTDERLGQIILAAVINGLLYERGLLCGSVQNWAMVPEAPCPEQTLAAIWEAHECGTPCT